MEEQVSIRKRISRRFAENSFLKNVLFVSGGTALAQIILFSISPVLSRIYSPNDFGVVAVYTSILGILSPLSTLRFYYAVPIEEDDRDAINALFTSLFVVFLMTGFVLLLSLVSSDFVVSVFDAQPIRPYLWLLSIGILGVGSYASMSSWMLRRNNYKAIARTKIAQGFARSLSQMLFGFLGVGPIGLIIGTIIGESAGIGTLVRQFIREDRALVTKINLGSIMRIVYKYKDFMLIGTWSAILNMAVTSIPVLYLSALYGAQMVGSFSFANKILALPMSLIGASVAQVFFGEGSKYAISNPSQLLVLVSKSFKKLFQIALIPAAILFPLGPFLFSLVFGSQWREAGEYARWLSLLLVFRFSVQPFYETLDLLKRQSLRLLLSMFVVGLIVITLFTSWKMGLTPLMAVIVYTVSMIFVYSTTYLVIIYAIKSRIREVKMN